MQKRLKKHVWPSIISQLAVLGLAVGLCAELALPQSAATPASSSTASGTATQAATQAKDPGVRGGTPGAGGPLSNLSSSYSDFFTAALDRFQEVDSVSGTAPNENGNGLGPRFNSNSCSSCHAFPSFGGTSPATNPQVAVATLDGARNSLPSFITIDGPVREARFIRKPDGTPDGGVHDLFVITGRFDSKACNISQPDFAAALASHNVIFRIPTPLFGVGLVESITDDAIVDNGANPAKAGAGISGRPNRSGNDGTVTRFGWKAQNKSLVMFAGEAYNVEQGVTNELFPNERDETPGCVLNPLPEDATNLTTNATYLPSGYSSDVVNFAMFARLSAPPAPMPPTAATTAGAAIFSQIGCALCHTPALKTGSTFLPTGQSNVSVNAFSDFLLHNMGSNLADNVSQGVASGSEFRTAPLWGLGQRIFFLHDGRTRNLLDAIEEHKGQGSEANQIINNFNQLTHAQAQELLDFLRAL
jgi:CxxC motif-containing protein (DUF1111 family)